MILPQDTTYLHKMVTMIILIILFSLFVILLECSCCISHPTIFSVCGECEVHLKLCIKIANSIIYGYSFYFYFCHLGTPKTLWSTFQTGDSFLCSILQWVSYLRMWLFNFCRLSFSINRVVWRLFYFWWQPGRCTISAQEAFDFNFW